MSRFTRKHRTSPRHFLHPSLILYSFAKRKPQFIVGAISKIRFFSVFQTKNPGLGDSKQTTVCDLDKRNKSTIYNNLK